MEGFNKKETLIRTICFMSFFVAINVVCSFLTTVLPLLSVILVIFLPLTSALVEVMCKDRWFPIYALATIGLSIVVSLQTIDFTLFYIIPSIFTGYIFGLFSKRNYPRMFAIFIASLIQMVLSVYLVYFIQLITGLNIFDKIAEILRISHRFLFDCVILLGFFVVGLVQSILSYIVVENELTKFGQKPAKNNVQVLVPEYTSLLSIVLLLIFSFIYLPLSVLFLGFTFYFCVFAVINHVKGKQKLCLILDGVFVLIGIFWYALMNKYIPDGADILLFTLVPGLISVFSIFYYFLKKSE